MKKWTIFFLCHFYPIFIILHLVYGNWSRVSQVIFNIVPIGVFGTLFSIWVKYPYGLSRLEKLSLQYLIFMLTVIYIYYCLCIYSTSEWIYNHNYQISGFVFLSLICYIYTIYGQRSK